MAESDPNWGAGDLPAHLSPDHPWVDTEGTWWTSVLKPGDRERVEEIAEKEWGDIDEEFLDKVLGESGAHTGFVARTTEGVVGFAMFGYIDAPEMEDWLQPANIDCQTNGERYSYLHTLAVVSDWQSEGIGSALVRRWLDHSEPAHNVTHAITVSWHRDDHHDSRAVFEKHGLKQLVTVDQFYWTPTYTRTTCPDCPGICTCAASVYCKFLKHPSETDT